VNKKCNDWMHPREFVQNNIEYRISSCTSLVSFKKNQEFILNQMAFNPFHKFSKISKEILLLKYDVWYDFLNETEQYILCNFTMDAEELIEGLISLSNERVVYYYDLLASEFTADIEVQYLQEWNKQHSKIYDYLVMKIRELKNQSPTIIFRRTVDILNDVMAHTLYELQEIDVLLFSEDETPGISIDDICVYLHSKDNKFLFNKIKDYQAIRPFSKMVIKNQTQENLENKCHIFFSHLAKENNIEYIII